MVLFGTVRANGAVSAPLIILAIGLVPVRLGFALGAYHWLGADAFGWSFPVSSFANIAMAIAFYLHGGWRKARMDIGRAPPIDGGMHRGSARHARAGRRASTRRGDEPRERRLSACANDHASFPYLRMRRGRSSPWMRAMLAENRLHPSDFIWPLFVCEGRDCEEPIGSLPGVSRWSVDRLGAKAREAADARHSLHRAVSQHAERAAHRRRATKRSTATI